MKVLFHTYDLAFLRLGGGEQVMLSLALELRRRNVEVEFYDPWTHNPHDFDLIHFFSSRQREDWAFFRRHYGDIPFLVTPTLAEGTGGPRARLRKWGESLGSLGAFRQPQRFFPSTACEAALLRRRFFVPDHKIRILPNGIDPALASGDPRLARERLGGARGRPLLLCVGRFESVKNQRLLIEALREFDELNCVFLGSADAGEPRYFESCHSLAKEISLARNNLRIEFWPTLPAGDPMLASLYAAADVYVQPSQFETFGLAALEAAAAGCSLAVTSGVADPEIFGNCVTRFFSPHRVEDCREALRAALSVPRERASRPEILKKFAWPAVAARLHAFYEELSVPCKHSGS